MENTAQLLVLTNTYTSKEGGSRSLAVCFADIPLRRLNDFPILLNFLCIIPANCIICCHVEMHPNGKDFPYFVAIFQLFDIAGNFCHFTKRKLTPLWMHSCENISLSIIKHIHTHIHTHTHTHTHTYDRQYIGLINPEYHVTSDVSL